MVLKAPVLVKGLDEVLRENDAYSEVAGKANTGREGLSVSADGTAVNLTGRLRFAFPDGLPSNGAVLNNPLPANTPLP